MEHWAHNDLFEVLFRFAPSFGSSADEICAGIGLDIERATYLGGIVPAGSLIDAMEWCARRSGYADFGLRVAERTNHRITGLAGLLVERALSLPQFFDLAARHLPMYNTGYSYRFDPDPAGPSSRLIIHCQSAFPPRHYAEGNIAIQAGMLRRMFGADWRPAGVEFAHPPLGAEAAYRAAFDAPVRFESSRNALLFKPEDLKWRSHGAEFRGEVVVDGALRDLALVEVNDLAAKVERLVKARLPQPSSLESIASELAMSSRSLQRRLAEQGASFTEILTRARVTLAQDYLRHPGVSLVEVAARLGFRHASVLSRMLKRELGASPKDLRK